MVWYSLHSIVRNVLMRRGYTIHYYIDFLVSGKDCLRQMALDSMPIINTKLLAVNQDTNAAPLPADYQDYTKIGVRVGQWIKPLVERDSINRMTYNVNGVSQMYQGITDIPTISNNIFPVEQSLISWDTVTWDSYGEYVGRNYGMSGAGSESDTFKVIPERNEIQLDERMSVQAIYIEYISDGMDSDAASKINAYAVDVIEAYIIWQFKEQNSYYNDGERMRAYDEYARQYSIYLARKSSITVTKLRALVNKNYKGSPKT